MYQDQQFVKNSQGFTDVAKESPLTFGIYAGSKTGEGTQGPVDNPVHINSALDQLQGESNLFLVRGYEWYVGADKTTNLTPQNLEYYVNDKRKLDFVLCYRDLQGDLRDGLRVYELLYVVTDHILLYCRLRKNPIILMQHLVAMVLSPIFTRRSFKVCKLLKRRRNDMDILCKLASMLH